MNGNLITDDIRSYAKCLRLSNFAQNCSDYFHKAQIDKPAYQDFVLNVFKTEVEERQKRELQRRIKKAKLPRFSDLDAFDFNHSAGITRMQLGQLRELAWLDQMYNIILMGPSGTGKTYITGGLIRDAVMKGYKAQFIAMDQLVEILRMKNVSSSAMSAYKHLTKCNLVGIDDIMLMPMKKEEAVAFFNMVNTLYETPRSSSLRTRLPRNGLRYCKTRCLQRHFSTAFCITVTLSSLQALPIVWRTVVAS